MPARRAFGVSGAFGASGAGGAGGGGGAGLRARPAPGPEVVAMVAAAMDQLLAEAASVPGTRAPVGSAAQRAWRFSGRWWSVPLPARQPRPWIGRGPWTA